MTDPIPMHRCMHCEWVMSNYILTFFCLFKFTSSWEKEMQEIPRRISVILIGTRGWLANTARKCGGSSCCRGGEVVSNIYRIDWLWLNLTWKARTYVEKFPKKVRVIVLRPVTSKEKAQQEIDTEIWWRGTYSRTENKDQVVRFCEGIWQGCRQSFVKYGELDKSQSSEKRRI